MIIKKYVYINKNSDKDLYNLCQKIGRTAFRSGLKYALEGLVSPEMNIKATVALHPHFTSSSPKPINESRPNTLKFTITADTDKEYSLVLRMFVEKLPQVCFSEFCKYIIRHVLGPAELLLLWNNSTYGIKTETISNLEDYITPPPLLIPRIPKNVSPQAVAVTVPYEEKYEEPKEFIKPVVTVEPEVESEPDDTSSDDDILSILGNF